MNTPMLPLPVPAPIPDAEKKKRVLLVDTSHAKRDLRAEVMRKCGIDVDSAADITEALSWWRPGLYDLVLMNVERGKNHRDQFCGHIRSATPPQRIAFFVGQPEYLSKLPNAAQEVAGESHDELAVIRTLSDSAVADPQDTTQRWGILEASRRISAVRSASIARTNAIRSLPPPPRDYEGRPERSAHKPTSLDDLLREELR